MGTYAISLGIKGPELEADHSTSFSAELNPLKPSGNYMYLLL
jgi:hypothetical protein